MIHTKIRHFPACLATQLSMHIVQKLRLWNRRTVCLGLGIIGVASVSTFTIAKPLDDINQYADRCAAEMGAGAGAYMPIGIFPNPPDNTGTEEIPVFWNGKRITYRVTDPTKPEDGEYVFDGMSGKKAGEVGGPYPDGANTAGKITRKQDLKCDFWSHVNEENGCVPGQRILRKDVGTCMEGTKVGQACSADAGCDDIAGACQDIVTWTFIFRREQPPVPGAPWEEAMERKKFHPYYFNNMDAIAFKKDTGATCWFDTFQTDRITGRQKLSTTVNKWWESATPGVPQGIPRPGGKDTNKQTRAESFWNTPKDVMDPVSGVGERCIHCHGNGPVLVTRWINQGGAFTGRIAGEIPYWHAAKLFFNPFFQNFAASTKPAMECGGSCHGSWSVSASTMPGGGLANAMTQNPIPGHASNYRLQIDDLGMAFAGTCMGGGNNGNACDAQSLCPDGACKGGQNAGILREMPHPFRVDALDGSRVPGTPKDWDTIVKPEYDAMKVCLRVCAPGNARMGQTCADNTECLGSTCPAVDATQCNDAEQADIPDFFGAQDLDASEPPTSSASPHRRRCRPRLLRSFAPIA